MNKKKVLIDFNGTIEIMGKLNTELLEWVENNKEKASFYIWTHSERSIVRDFIVKNKVDHLFIDILNKFTRVECDLLIDDDPRILEMMKRHAKNSVIVTDFSALKNDLL